MKAVFVSDANPAYLGFWKPQARHMWTRFGLRSRLYYIAAAPNPSLFTSDYAEVCHIPLVSTVPAIVQALFAKWYFPGHESSEERLFVCDIDCFLLSTDFVAKVAQGTSFFHLASLENGHIPGYYVAGTPEQFRTFFRGDGVTFEEFCQRALRESTHVLPEAHVGAFSKAASPDWKYFGSEEHYAGACAKTATLERDCSIPSPNPSTNRICRSWNSHVDPQKVRRNEYMDYHCPRPYEDYESVITGVLKQFS